MGFQVIYNIKSLRDDLGFANRGRIVIAGDTVTIHGRRPLRNHAIFGRVIVWAFYLFGLLTLLAQIKSHIPSAGHR